MKKIEKILSTQTIALVDNGAAPWYTAYTENDRGERYASTCASYMLGGGSGRLIGVFGVDRRADRASLYVANSGAVDDRFRAGKL